MVDLILKLRYRLHQLLLRELWSNSLLGDFLGRIWGPYQRATTELLLRNLI